ncbi:hypothetical protein SDJN03_16175, partial [Cucurbita argyrosperma subsp. sororia]
MYPIASVHVGHLFQRGTVGPAKTDRILTPGHTASSHGIEGMEKVNKKKTVAIVALSSFQLRQDVATDTLTEVNGVLIEFEMRRSLWRVDFFYGGIETTTSLTWISDQEGKP